MGSTIIELSTSHQAQDQGRGACKALDAERAVEQDAVIACKTVVFASNNRLHIPRPYQNSSFCTRPQVMQSYQLITIVELINRSFS